MRRTRTHAFAAVLLALLLADATAGPAQDRRLLSTKVADILARFPRQLHPQGPAGAEILGLGEEGIGEIARQLVPAGSGNETSVRFALNAMAAYASRFGWNPSGRWQRKRLPRPGRRFGSRSEDLSPEPAPACGARGGGPGGGAVPAGRDAFRAGDAADAVGAKYGRAPGARRGAGTFQGCPQVTIVKALGELRAAEANDAILRLANAPGLPLRKAALAALADIASLRSHLLLPARPKKPDMGMTPRTPQARC